MLKAIVSTVFIFISFLLQCTVFQHFSFGGIVPNLTIIVTSSYGFMRGRKSGLVVGFFCGLLMDIFFGNLLGFHALIYMYIGFLNGVLGKTFFPEDIRLPMALILGSDFVYGITCYLLAFLLSGRFDFGYYFLNIIIPEMVYTILITCIFYPLILVVESYLKRKEKEGAKNIVQ